MICRIGDYLENIIIQKEKNRLIRIVGFMLLK